MFKKVLTSIFIFVMITSFSITKANQFEVSNGRITESKPLLYNNRPIYINNSNAFILTGSKPLIRMAQLNDLYGTFRVGIKRNNTVKWVCDFTDITSTYDHGRMFWQLSDAKLSTINLTLEVLPMNKTKGMVLKLNVQDASPGDSVVWSLNGAEFRDRTHLSWRFDILGNPDLLKWGYSTKESEGNIFSNINGNGYILTEKTNSFQTRITCSAKSNFTVSSAMELNAAPLTDTALYGTFKPTPGQAVFWSVEGFNSKRDKNPEPATSPEISYNNAIQRLESLHNRVKVSTPDPYLNALATSSVIAVDGTWYAPMFVHGAMQWNSPYVGWRTSFGGAMYGWHDRVLEQAKYLVNSQVKTSTKTRPQTDTVKLMTKESSNSRFYGVGYVSAHQSFYNMQTQYFDQLIEAWRFTADPELEKVLREGLALHLVWQEECFDPDGDGTYESYINSWPSDSQWYNGGGSAEETSYAYRGHLAARDLARRAGDVAAEKHHSQMVEKIKKGFFEKLWIQEKGHSGAYREQGGHQRLHTNPWLYSIFLPVDAGLTNNFQHIESVYYTEWALQNDRRPLGGRSVWASNWVPGIWSVRVLWPGDNYHLALSYFKAGLSNDGYDIFRGAYMQSGFNEKVPGNLGDPSGGIDFGDCVHTFTRTLVSGLFGYNPDFPNNIVKLQPRFPSQWDSASIEIPDAKLHFLRKNQQTRYSFELTKAANVTVEIPVGASKINRVTVDGKKVKFTVVPYTGSSLVVVNLATTQKGELVIHTDNSGASEQPVALSYNAGEQVKLTSNRGTIEAMYDPQGIFTNSKIASGTIYGTIKPTKGYHTFFATIKNGSNRFWRIYRVQITDPEGDAREKAKFIDKVPANANWSKIDISNSLNADVTEIYKQKYLSHRPNTVSARIGTDGYSAWTYPHWNVKAPAIELNNLPALVQNSTLLTPQQVPFAWNTTKQNVAFTSIWDNYPDSLQFSVNQRGKGIWFLVVGSTNVMQCEIANAVIKLHYADGVTESLELVPPINYWNLSTIFSNNQAPGAGLRNDYTAEVDKFCLPEKLPEIVQLGKNCRAMLLNLKMRENVILKTVTLETLSQEVVVGLMGISIHN